MALIVQVSRQPVSLPLYRVVHSLLVFIALRPGGDKAEDGDDDVQTRPTKPTMHTPVIAFLKRYGRRAR